MVDDCYVKNFKECDAAKQIKLVQEKSKVPEPIRSN